MARTYSYISSNQWEAEKEYIVIAYSPMIFNGNLLGWNFNNFKKSDMFTPTLSENERNDFLDVDLSDSAKCQILAKHHGLIFPPII